MLKMHIDRARMIYESALAVIKDRRWVYKEESEDLMINFIVMGKKDPIPFTFSVDSSKRIAELYAPLTFTVGEGKKRAFSVAIGQTNYEIYDGLFVIDMTDGMVYYKMTHKYKPVDPDGGDKYYEDLIGSENFLYMVENSCKMLGRFSDKFEAINNGKMSLSEFFDYLTTL